MSQHQTPADIAGIKRAAPAAAAEVAPDPLDEVMSALDDLIEFTANDAINAGSFNPSLQGPNEPDSYGADQHYAAVLIAVRKLLAPLQITAPPQAAPHPAPGILTTHNPAARRFVS